MSKVHLFIMLVVAGCASGLLYLVLAVASASQARSPSDTTAYELLVIAILLVGGGMAGLLLEARNERRKQVDD